MASRAAGRRVTSHGMNRILWLATALLAAAYSSVGEAPVLVHKLSDMQADALKAALRDLGDARKLLDPTSRI